jgi:hypothetical protein
MKNCLNETDGKKIRERKTKTTTSYRKMDTQLYCYMPISALVDSVDDQRNFLFRFSSPNKCSIIVPGTNTNHLINEWDTVGR